MVNKISKTKIKNKSNGVGSAKNTQENSGALSFRLIVAIVEHGSADDIVEMLLQKFGVKLHVVCQGDGTADSAILQLLNLDKSSKDVVICAVETAKCPEILQGIQDSYEGGGIAFSIKLNSIGGMRTLKLLKNDFVALKNENDDDRKE